MYNSIQLLYVLEKVQTFIEPLWLDLYVSVHKINMKLTVP